MENGKPIRMCIVCKRRFPQHTLQRLQCEKQKLISFSGRGRSFYVCKDCIFKKEFVKKISFLCKISKEEAKEMINNFPFSILH